MKTKLRHGIDLVEVAGVQIAIDPSWIVVFVLVLWSLSTGYFPHEYPGYGAAHYWGIGAVATVLFFASVVIHELAHAFVANRLGQPVRRITLFIFGGMAHLSREPRSGATELKIAAVGPLTSLALAATFWAVATWLHDRDASPLWLAAPRYLAIINTALAVFNLLPGFPLDGGRILRAVLWLRTGDLRAATARTSDLGAGIGLGLMGLGILQIFAGSLVGGLWLVFIGMFLRGAARAGYEGMILEQALGAAIVADVVIVDPIAIPDDATVARAIDDYFLRHGFGGFPVTRDNQIVGVVSLTHIKRCGAAERASRRVREIMRPAEEGVCIAATASLRDALQRMAASGSGRLLVVQGGRASGLITRTGITRFLHMKSQLEESGS